MPAPPGSSDPARDGRSPLIALTGWGMAGLDVLQIFVLEANPEEIMVCRIGRQAGGVLLEGLWGQVG